MIVSHTNRQTLFHSLRVESPAAGMSLLLESCIHQAGIVLQSAYPRIKHQQTREDLTWLLGEEWYTEQIEQSCKTQTCIP